MDAHTYHGTNACKKKFTMPNERECKYGKQYKPYVRMSKCTTGIICTIAKTAYKKYADKAIYIVFHFFGGRTDTQFIHTPNYNNYYAYRKYKHSHILKDDKDLIPRDGTKKVSNCMYNRSKKSTLDKSIFITKCQNDRIPITWSEWIKFKSLGIYEKEKHYSKTKRKLFSSNALQYLCKYF